MGAAGGAALAGLRPVAELMFADFVGVSMDQIFNQMAKRVAAVGEPWKTFFDPATLLAHLRHLGFTSAEDFGADVLNRRYFASRTDKLKIGGMGHMAMARL